MSDKNFKDLVEDFDLFSEEDDQLADDYFDAIDSEFKPFDVHNDSKTHNDELLTAKEEYYTFIDMQNIKTSQVANLLSIYDNAKELLKHIRAISENRIDFRNVVSETFQESYVYDKYESGKKENLDIEIISKAFSDIAKYYDLFIKNKDADYLLQLGEASKLISFTPDVLCQFQNNFNKLKSDIDKIKPNIRELIVDDCRIKSTHFVRILSPDDNVFDKSFDDYIKTLKGLAPDPLYVERRLDDARGVYDMVAWVSKKHFVNFGNLNKIVANNALFDRDYDKLVDKVINSNIRWIYSVVNSSLEALPGASMQVRDEMLAEAKAGYCEGISRFNVHYGYRINTYATKYAELYLRGYNIGNQDIVKIPLQIKGLFSKLHKYRDAFEDKFGYKPSINETAFDLDMSQEKIKELDLAFVNFNVGSLDTHLDEEDGAKVVDMVADDMDVDWDAIEVNVKQREFIEERICLLSELERHALKFTDPITDPYGKYLEMDFTGTCLALQESDITPTFVDRFILENEDSKAFDGYGNGRFTPEKLKLVSDIAKNRMFNLSHFDSVTLKHINTIKNFIDVFKERSDDYAHVLSSFDIANELKINHDSLKCLIGVCSKFGFELNVSDLSDCINEVDDDVKSEFWFSNNDEILSLGILPNLNTLDASEIGIKSFALRSEQTYKVMDVNVLSARSELMNELEKAKEDTLMLQGAKEQILNVQNEIEFE